MAFDWIVPHIRCRIIFEPSIIISLDSKTQWFHQRAVTIDKLDSIWDTTGGEIPLALVRAEKKQLWAQYEWLRPLSASSKCICSLDRIMSQGCKCGGN